jgi:host factor-I protein
LIVVFAGGRTSRAADLKEKKVNRKLIRPSLTELKDQMANSSNNSNNNNSRQQRKKPAPPDQTNAENFYYVKQMQAKTPMVLVLQDGEQIRGVIEWYDRSCVKVHRSEGPNLLIYKPSIKYLYKENEGAEKA